jgi:membrane protein required for colicin V production
MRNTDIILLVLLLWGTCWGFYKGLISQLASLVGIVLAFYVSIKYYEPVASILTNHIDSKTSRTYISIAAFVLLFVLLLVLIYFLSKLIEKLTKALQIGSLNHLAGGLFGLIKWAFILSFIILLINKFGQEIDHTLVNFHDTWIYNHVAMIAPDVLPGLLDKIRN